MSVSVHVCMRVYGLSVTRYCAVDIGDPVSVVEALKVELRYVCVWVCVCVCVCVWDQLTACMSLAKLASFVIS